MQILLRDLGIYSDETLTKILLTCLTQGSFNSSDVLSLSDKCPAYDLGRLLCFLFTIV